MGKIRYNKNASSNRQIHKSGTSIISTQKRYIKGTSKRGNASILLLLLISLLVFGWLAFLFRADLAGVMSQFSGSLPKTAQNHSVTVTLGADRQSQIIGRQGGEIKTDTGGNYSLSFPGKSLLTSAEVSVETIKDMANMGTGMSFVNGVHILSEDAILTKPVTLQLAIPENTKPENLMGFSYTGEGEDFNLYPIKINGKLAEFQLSHFSGYGLIAVDSSFKEPPSSNSVRTQAQSYIAKIINEAGRQQYNGRDEAFTEPELQKITSLLKAWFKTGVRPLLELSQSNDELLIDAAKEYLVWWQSVQGVGLEGRLGSEIDEGKNSLVKAINNAAQKAYQKCQQSKDPSQAGRLIKIAALADFLGQEKISGLDPDAIKQKAMKCANFKLKIKSRFYEPAGSWENSVVCPGVGKDNQYSGEIVLSIDEDFNLTGEGEMKEDKISFCEHPCAGVKGNKVSMKVKVPQTRFAVQKGKPSASVYLDVEAQVENKYDCTFAADVFDKFGVMEDESWESTYSLAHEEEMLNKNTIKIPDMDVVNKNGVYASKVYDRPISGLILSTPKGDARELTVIDLIHTPK